MELNPRTVNEIRNQTEIGLAYVAGYIDGEGCITVKGDRKIPTAVVSTSNTFLPLLSLLCEVFGGSIRHIIKYKDVHREAYSWEIYSKDAISFLIRIEPYLIEKRWQSQLIIQWFTGNRWEDGLTKEFIIDALKEMKRFEY